MSPATADKRNLGSVTADELLTLPAIKERLGLGVAAMRTARRRGLKVLRIGSRGFVTGQSLIDYLTKFGK